MIAAAQTLVNPEVAKWRDQGGRVVGYFCSSFPDEIVKKRCAAVECVIVVEMNMGQILHEVKRVSGNPGKVFLANRIDGSFIAPADILNILRIIQGKGA